MSKDLQCATWLLIAKNPLNLQNLTSKKKYYIYCFSSEKWIVFLFKFCLLIYFTSAVRFNFHQNFYFLKYLKQETNLYLFESLFFFFFNLKIHGFVRFLKFWIEVKKICLEYKVNSCWNMFEFVLTIFVVYNNKKYSI